MDRSIFRHYGTGIPIEIRYFFGITNMERGEKRPLTLLLGDRRYSANLEMTVLEPPRTRLIWRADFNSEIEGLFPQWARFFQNEDAKPEDTPTMKFERVSDQSVYRIEFTSEGMNMYPSFENPLKPGDIIDNNELRNIFSVGTQGGMRRSHSTNTLVIISDHTKAIYEDRWIGDIFHYTGMGLSGDQRLDFMQNKTLAESHKNGVNVHLFEVFDSGRYTYHGEVLLADDPYQEEQPDVQGNLRNVYVFPLKLKSASKFPIISQEALKKKGEEQQKIARKLTDAELEKRARYSRKGVGSREVTTKTYERNQYVVESAKRRAGGICQLCGNPAPFMDKNGLPFLETHHIEWLSKGGEDTIENTVALCPNCHRKMHIVDSDQDKNLLIGKIR